MCGWLWSGVGGGRGVLQAWAAPQQDGSQCPVSMLSSADGFLCTVQPCYLLVYKLSNKNY